MPKKRGFTADRYQEEIMKILRQEHFMSTSEITDRLNMGYKTGLKYIELLYAKNMIKLKERGNRKFWFIGL